MPLHQHLLTKLLDFLKTSSLFKSVPLSLLLIGLEALMDPHFSCPCRVLQNRLLTVAIFIGPALFTFFLMFLFVRPFRHGWFHCPDGENDDTQKNWPKSLISCLVPPVMWIFLLFHDGDYFTCGMTDWDGCYVFNKKMNMSWCHPYPEGNNMWCNTSSEDDGKMHHTLEYFHNSEVIGYCVISVFSVLAVVFVGIYDCFVTGKCDCLPNQLLCCCRRRLPYSGVSAMKGADVTLRANTEIQTGDKIFWMFGYDNSLVAKNTGEESEFSDDRFKDKVDLNPQTGDLTIKKIKTIHTGKYKLKIIRNGKASFKIFNVTLSGRVNKSVLQGRYVILDYDTKIQRDDEIQWKFGGKLIAEMTGENRENPQWSHEFRHQMKLDPQTGSLIIQQTRPEHSGLYKLEINTRDYSTSRLFSLTVCDEMKLVSVMMWADVTLPAKIQRGDEIIWMFGDHNWLLAKNTDEKCEEESECSDPRFKPDVDLNRQTGDLTIKKIETFHTGEYKLKIIKNRKSSFKLFIVSVSGITPHPESSPIATASYETPARSSQSQDTADTQNAADSDEPPARSSQSQDTAESMEMRNMNQQNQETPLDSVVSQT